MCKGMKTCSPCAKKLVIPKINFYLKKKKRKTKINKFSKIYSIYQTD